MRITGNKITILLSFLIESSSIESSVVFQSDDDGDISALDKVTAVEAVIGFDEHDNFLTSLK